MSVFDEVACEHVGSVEAVGEHRVNVIAAAVEIQEYSRKVVLHQAVDVVLRELTQHDESVDLVVKNGVGDFLDGVGVGHALVVDHLEHSVVVLILEQLHDIAVNYPVERACVADEVLRYNYPYVVGQAVLRTVGTCMYTVAHFSSLLLYPLAKLHAYAVAVAQRL